MAAPGRPGPVPPALRAARKAYALARTPAGKLGATTYAVPAIVVLLSWILLGQVRAWLSLLGGLLCLTGVAISRYRGRAQRVPSARAVAPTPQPVDTRGR
ncbi:EamA family transporter [Streptomyces lavendofoliae]|uniref:EamA family transporter n=1 Tax=Streptomyces lavendofoliae TaxID=67314 RepID=UPI0035711196